MTKKEFNSFVGHFYFEFAKFEGRFYGFVAQCFIEGPEFVFTISKGSKDKKGIEIPLASMQIKHSETGSTYLNIELQEIILLKFSFNQIREIIIKLNKSSGYNNKELSNLMNRTLSIIEFRNALIHNWIIPTTENDGVITHFAYFKREKSSRKIKEIKYSVETLFNKEKELRLLEFDFMKSFGQHSKAIRDLLSTNPKQHGKILS